MGFDSPDYEQSATIADALHEADAVLVTTEWREIVGADWAALLGSMREPRYV